MNFELKPEDEYSQEFSFKGDCYISIVGDGIVTIERRVGKIFVPMTLQDGTEMTFAGEGVIFNSSISANKEFKHRLKVATSSGLMVDIVKER